MVKRIEAHPNSERHPGYSVLGRHRPRVVTSRTFLHAAVPREFMFPML